MSILYEQFKKHKRKFIYLSGLAGSAFAIYKFTKLIQYWNNEYQVNNNLELKIQKAEYFRSALLNSSKTVKSILENVENEIELSIDSENVASSLGVTFKTCDQKIESDAQYAALSADTKLELWQKLKVLSFTKLILLIYSWSFISVTIHIQMSILAGNLFQHNNMHRHSNPFLTYYKMVFQSKNQNSIDEKFQHEFINFTLKQIQLQIGTWTEFIENTCRKIIGPISLKTLLSIEDVRAMITKIKNAVHNDILGRFLQIIQVQHGIGPVQTSIYGLFSNMLESSGIGQIDGLIEILSSQVCCQIGVERLFGVVTMDGMETESLSKQPLAKLIPFVWEGFRTENNKVALFDRLKHFCADSNFRFLMFNAYENGMNTVD